MFKNYFKIAMRQMGKNKGFSFLNMFGLALGLTGAIFILLWIQEEIGYNKFHSQYDNLYQVMENQRYGEDVFTFASTPGLLASSMREEMPEVKNAARLAWGERWLFNKNGEPIYESGNYVDPEFFEMFSFEFIYGDLKTALPNERAIVLTEKTTQKFFGNQNPVGKFITINNKSEFIVSAVVKNPPPNSSIQFNWLVSFKNYERQNEGWTSWTNNSLQTFVQLKPDINLEAFNEQFKGYIKNKNEDASAEPLLLAMKDWRLRSHFEGGKQSGGRIEHVKLFSLIAVLLIIIACINFMNLATARSEQRSKEVGLRKVMGAKRGNLISQFIGESVIMAFLSMFMACLLAQLFLPSFNELVGKELNLGFDSPLQWLLFIGIAVVCGFVAGSYPSFYLSSFKPISIFKGLRQNNKFGPTLIRKGLVVTQFVMSIILIVSTIVIFRQIEHVKERHLGFNKDNLIYLNQKGMMNSRLKIIEEDLLATGVVSHASGCSQTVLQMGNNSSGFRWEGKDDSRDVLITTDFVGHDYINTVGMKLLSGRDFYKNADIDSTCVLINETMAKLIDKKDPLNTILTWDTTRFTVIGVVQDFLFNNMYGKPDPVILFCYEDLTRKYFIRLKENVDTETALTKIETVFKKDNPGYPFEYNFMDTEFDKQFKNEMLIGKLSRLFGTLTIFISCIGLFGLAAFTAERRTKEIGVRKVLGATVKSLVALLSIDFLRLVLIAIVIACPLAWYMMTQWLQDYPYRIELEWWIFVVSGFSALAIALLTVSFQAIKAAIANPVKSLRTE